MDDVPDGFRADPALDRSAGHVGAVVQHASKDILRGGPGGLLFRHWLGVHDPIWTEPPG